MPESPLFQTALKSSVFDRIRQLTISETYIEFDDHDLISKLPTRFSKEEIGAFRFGVEWIRGYSFAIGRIYCIDVRNNQNKIIKLRLKSIYGIRRKQLTDKYINIVNALYENIFNDISRQYLALFDNQVDFELEGMQFSQRGVILNTKSDLVDWEQIGTGKHKTYFTIYPKADPSAYRAFEYLHHWNAGIVYSVLHQILKNKGLLN